MIFSGEIIALATALSWSIGIFPFSEASKRTNPNMVNHVRMVFAVLILAIISFFTTSNISNLFSTNYNPQWIWLCLSGIVGLAIGDYFSFSSFVYLGPRLSSVFSTLAPGTALLLGIAFLGEKFNWIGLVGMFITIAGVIWISLNKKTDAEISNQLSNYKIGIIYAILAAVLQGVGVVLAKKGLEQQNINAIQATWLRMFGAAISLYLISYLSKKIKPMHKPILKNTNNVIPFIILGTLFGPVIGVSLSMQAISMLDVSVAQTIFSLVPVMVLPLAYIFYKEKITAKLFIGACIAIIGVVILIWRDTINSLF